MKKKPRDRTNVSPDQRKFAEAISDLHIEQLQSLLPDTITRDGITYHRQQTWTADGFYSIKYFDVTRGEPMDIGTMHPRHKPNPIFGRNDVSRKKVLILALEACFGYGFLPPIKE